MSQKKTSTKTKHKLSPNGARKLSARTKAKMAQAMADTDWVFENEERLQQEYQDETIVVHHKTVVAHHANYGTAIDEAVENGYQLGELVALQLRSENAEIPSDFI